MSYKTISVCTDGSENALPRQEFAAALAAKHAAYLLGLYTRYTPVFIDPYGEFAVLAKELEEADDKNRERAKAAFLNAAATAGIQCSWTAYRSYEQDRLIAKARGSDLAIVGGLDPSDGNAAASRGFWDGFVLRVGRPTLFLPWARKVSVAFETIVIAWDGGRESARAIADALPFLRAAKIVRVLTAVGKHTSQDLLDVDVAAYLARHEVKAEIGKPERIEVDASEWLLSRIAQDRADLLVMGAYGHNRFSELVLGGVTRRVLREMTLPVLMSH